MIFPRKKLILPCHKNGYLQSASDARKYRDRFKRNPLAKVADMFIPKPLRMSPGYPCCCGGSEPGLCSYCLNDEAPMEMQVTFYDIENLSCNNCNLLNDPFVLSYNEGMCNWTLNTPFPVYCEGNPDPVLLGISLTLYYIGGIYSVYVLATGILESSFYKTYPSKPNCMTFANESIPLLSSTGSLCEAGEAALVTSL